MKNYEVLKKNDHVETIISATRAPRRTTHFDGSFLRSSRGEVYSTTMEISCPTK
jgi:hypothetical protein